MPTDFAPHTLTSSDVKPYIAASSSNVNATFPPWKAFNGADANADRWISGGASPQWLELFVGTPQVLASYDIRTSIETGRAPKDWKMQGSFDRGSWTDLDTRSGQTGWSDPETRSYAVTGNTTAYLFYRLYITDSNGSNPAVSELYLYTNTVDNTADVAPHNMTGSTSPSPYIATDDGNVGGNAGWMAFDGGGGQNWISAAAGFPTSVTLDIGTPKTILGYALWNVNAFYPTAWTLYGSSDGSSWTSLDSQTSQDFDAGSGNPAGLAYGLSAESAAYRYYKLTLTAGLGTNVYLNEMYLVPGPTIYTPPIVPHDPLEGFIR